MQLLNPPLSQLPADSIEPLLDTFQDIANNVRIESEFCISHPDYKPLKFSRQVVERFKQMPSDVQNMYLNLQLRSFLYGIYYNASLRTVLASDDNSVDLAVYQNLENNTYLGVNLEFYKRLHESNCGEGYFDPGWFVLKQECDGSLAVKKGSLILHIDRTCHLQPTQVTATVGDSVAIRMPRNLIQNGFYVAVGNAGSENSSNLNVRTVRIYFNLSPEGAIAIVSAIARQLNKVGIPFTFKALYNPSSYGRYDAAVLYFDRNNYEIVRQIVETVYAENHSHFYQQVPLFAKLLAPGLALAEEPDRKFAATESFGMNRCQIVANGLLDAWQKGKDSPESRVASILQQFSQLGIDCNKPYLNANSQDIYTGLYL
ncbi:T3SS effector HopA1 family protein [Microcoleus sp. herbarium12]|uniref:T3SS effector HopA1 family protein n=1 Tax=Microcoleus sp. herbarium12 TaxID=3055437 RepID=UPI002FD6FD3D